MLYGITIEEWEGGVNGGWWEGGREGGGWVVDGFIDLINTGLTKK